MRSVALAICLLVAGCGAVCPSPADAGTNACGDVLPSGCPLAPSYANAVAPLVAAHCLSCHAPGGQSEDKPLGSYASLFKRRETALVELHGCLMPPADAPSPLTESERHTLEQWLVCGAPEN